MMCIWLNKDNIYIHAI